MFNKLEKLSHYIVEKYIDGDEIEKEKCEYSLYGIISFVLGSLTAFVTSLIFGYWIYLVLIIVIIIYLRGASAGCHAETHRVCFIWTNLNYLFVGLSIVYLKQFYLIFFMLSLWSFTKLSKIPKYAKDALVHRVEIQQKFRLQYIRRIILLTVLNTGIMILLHNQIRNILALNLMEISILMSCCMILNKFSTTDISFLILEKLK